MVFAQDVFKNINQRAKKMDVEMRSFDNGQRKTERNY
jgi:hypothetical protein